MGAHHDFNFTPPKAFKPDLLMENEQADFDMRFSARTEVTYINNLSVTVYVADRLGGVMTVRPSQGIGKFCIRVSRTLGNGTIAHYKNDAFDVRKGRARPTATDIAVRENYTIMEGERGRFTPAKTKDLRVGIRLEDLEANDGVVYHEASDLVVSLTFEQAVHFGSPREVLKRAGKPTQYDESIPLAGNTAMVHVAIIKNKGRARDRYMQLAGEIHRIRPCKCPSRADGIYIEREGKTHDGTDIVGDGVDFYEFDDQVEKELGLFKSYEEALTWAEDLKLSAERELVKKKSELAITKVDLEKDSLERKDHFDEAATHRKDFYDYRSNHRKDTSEELKWILGITATLLGCLALFRR